MAPRKRPETDEGAAQATGTLPGGRVTFLFTDIEGSTRLVQELGGDQYRRLLEEHSGLLHRAIAAYGGQEFGTEGDAHFFVFRSASEAIAAATEAQRTLGSYPWPKDHPIRVRMGIHTGQPSFGGRNYVGVDLNRAARITSAGHGGQILASQGVIDEAAGSGVPEGVTFVSLGAHRLRDLAEPERISQVLAAGLATEFPSIRTIDTRPRHLPAQLSSFVGREREVGALLELLDGHRLVTLTGPGGSGKTRLAIATAERALPRFDDGVFFVSLGAIVDTALLGSAIAVVLGVRESAERPVEEVLFDHLAEKRLLLVLDNFEQLIAGASLVSRLLQAAADVRAIVTTRIALRVYGEREFPVPPLPVPSDGSLTALTDSPAVRLFVERAVAVRPGFELTADNAELVAEICRRVDGLPLAIELAAARVRVLALPDLLARLGRRLETLTAGPRDLPERQRTLRGAIAWSHDLLEPEERRLFARLAVFMGGWTLDAADAVCGGAGLTIGLVEGLESLVDKSLVRRETIAAGAIASADEVRFAMLETIREFALEQLSDGEDLASTAQRHGEFYLRLAEAAEPNLTGPEASRWIGAIQRDIDNLRAVLQRALAAGADGSLHVGLRTAGALWRFWQQTGQLREAAGWFEHLLARPAGAGLESARAKALIGAGGIVYWQNELARAAGFYEEALALYRGLSDRAGIAEALLNLGSVPLQTGDLGRARALFAEARSLFDELGDEFKAFMAASFDAYAALFEGDYETAHASSVGLLEAARRFGDRFWIVNALTGLGQSERLLGRYDEGRRHYTEALRLAVEANDLGSVTMALDPLANLESAAGDPARAVRLWTASQAIKERIGGGAPPEMMLVTDPTEDAIKALGDKEVVRGAAEGRSMSLAETVAYATRDTPADAEPASGSEPEGP